MSGNLIAMLAIILLLLNIAARMALRSDRKQHGAASADDTSEREAWASLIPEDRQWFVEHGYAGPPPDLARMFRDPQQGGFEVRLHVGDPGADGLANPSAGAPGSMVTRFADAGGGVWWMTRFPTWTCAEGVSETLTHASVWRDGVAMRGEPITFDSPHEWAGGNRFSLTSAKIHLQREGQAKR